MTTQRFDLSGSPFPHHGPPVGRAPDPVPDRYTFPDSRWPDFAPIVRAVEEAP
ncbi:hypothetical protein [Curtobacterium sp. 24E2]|nr:hypothetical protein JN350_16795 [Curtobacterium sp. 24E2]